MKYTRVRKHFIRTQEGIIRNIRNNYLASETVILSTLKHLKYLKQLDMWMRSLDRALSYEAI